LGSLSGHRCRFHRKVRTQLKVIRAVWCMEGDTVEEIAAKLGKSVRTVARKLAVIRDVWREEGGAYGGA
jgi:hypothetical protein